MISLSEFLQIMQKYFSDQIRSDKTGRFSAKDFMQNLFTDFTAPGDAKEYSLSISSDIAARILNGTKPLKTTEAAKLLTYIDESSFEDFYNSCGFSSSGEDKIIDAFAKVGVDISKGVPEGITEALKSILGEIVSKPKQTSIRYAEFTANNQVKIGKNTYNLPKALEFTDDVQYEENKYVDALLEVYSQDNKIDKITMDNIDETPLYSNHIKLQRRLYCSAQSVLHQIRDSNLFIDGVTEFAAAENEIFDSISQVLIRAYKNGLERANTTLDYVITIPNWKSNLCQNGNGLIGNGEKQGIIHMLVNDGKIKWVYEYDTDI